VSRRQELRAKHGKITRQELKPEGVVTHYEDGFAVLLPYEVNEAGESYVELFPNDVRGGT
jgi:hypothetical protein